MRSASGSSRAFAAFSRRPNGPRSSRSTCRSACRRAPATAGAGRRTRCGRCSGSASPRCSRSRRAGAIYADDYREACRVALRDLRSAAQGLEAAVHDRAEDPRSGRGLARRAPTRRRACSRSIPRWRSGASTASARSSEPKKVKGTPYEPGLALRRGLLVARGHSRGGGLRGAAARCRRGRSARCARLRDDRAAHSCRAGAAVSANIRPRRIRVADGDLGVREARMTHRTTSARLTRASSRMCGARR